MNCDPNFLATESPFRMCRTLGTRSVLILTLLLMPAGCGGKPVIGSPEFRQQIRDGKIVLWGTPMGSKGLVMITAAGAVKASSQGAWDIFTDVEHFPEFMYRMEKASVLQVRDPANPVVSRLINVSIDVPWPFANINVNADYICNEAGHICDLRVVEGNVVEMWGSFRLEDWEDGYTYVMFQLFADFGYDDLPPSAVNEVAEIISRISAQKIRDRMLSEPWVNMPRKQKKRVQPGDVRIDGLDDLMH